MIEQAIKYAKLKWPIFPANLKSPAIKDWRTLATINPQKIASLFNVHHTGIALATGKESGVIVVDIDNKNGVNGFLALENAGVELPDTVSVLTPTGGRHYYFKFIPNLKNSAGVLGSGSGVDIRTDGGLVILPPSMHPIGGTYEWMSDQSPWEIEIAEFPQELLRIIQKQNSLADGKKEGFSLPDKIADGQRNDILFRYASKLRGSGMKKPEVLTAVSTLNTERCENPLPQQEIKTVVDSACNYDEGTIYIDNKGKVKKTMLNVIGLFRSDHYLNGLFYYNLFTGVILYSRTPIWSGEIKAEKRLDDTDLIFIKHHLAIYHHLEVQTNLIQEAVIIVAHENSVHPVRDYLNSLKWDGVKRLSIWLTVAAGVNKNVYTSCVGMKTLVAAVARVFEPGIKYDTMLILEGDQGLGKSTLVKNLAGEWYSSITITDNDKDTVDTMRGGWIIEVEEMACFRREDLEHIKAFISRSVDNVRLAYRRNSEDFPRQSILIGTINPSGDKDYLRDQTGNRRFWPVLCTKPIDHRWIKDNRDQLFAEAVERYRNGEKLWIDDPEVEKIVKAEQEIRQSKDVWTKPIFDYVSQKREISAVEILKDCLDIPIGKANKSDQTRVGIVMKNLGWSKRHSKLSKSAFYYKEATKDF